MLISLIGLDKKTIIAYGHDGPGDENHEFPESLYWQMNKLILGNEPFILRKKLGENAGDRLIGHFTHFIADEIIKKLNITSKLVNYEKPGSWSRYLEGEKGKVGNPLVPDIAKYYQNQDANQIISLFLRYLRDFISANARTLVYRLPLAKVLVSGSVHYNNALAKRDKKGAIIYKKQDKQGKKLTQKIPEMARAPPL